MLRSGRPRKSISGIYPVSSPGLPAPLCGRLSPPPPRFDGLCVSSCVFPVSFSYVCTVCVCLSVRRCAFSRFSSQNPTVRCWPSWPRVCTEQGTHPSPLFICTYFPFLSSLPCLLFASIYPRPLSLSLLVDFLFLFLSSHAETQTASPSSSWPPACSSTAWPGPPECCCISCCEPRRATSAGSLWVD